MLAAWLWILLVLTCGFSSCLETGPALLLFTCLAVTDLSESAQIPSSKLDVRPDSAQTPMVTGTQDWAPSIQPALLPPWHVRWALGSQAHALKAQGSCLAPSFPTV